MVRLIALKLPEEQANLRRKRAKENRDKRLNHNSEYYQLLSYHLFISTEEKSQFTPSQIAQLYGLRWRIESIFKCWKSYFHLQQLIPQNRSVSKDTVESVIYLMLIFIVLFQVSIYQVILLTAEKKQNIMISLTKLCKFIADHIDLFLEQTLKSIIPLILYYCRYDQRCDRKNFLQKLKLS